MGNPPPQNCLLEAGVPVYDADAAVHKNEERRRLKRHFPAPR